jgi:hypothetical protein
VKERTLERWMPVSCPCEKKNIVCQILVSRFYVCAPEGKGECVEYSSPSLYSGAR